jgi:protein-disulfide isomerase
MEAVYKGENVSSKTWIIFAAVCILLFGGLVLWSGRDNIDVSNVKKDSVLSASETSGNIGDNVYGNKDAKVVLIEYGDFQCPGCAGAYPTLKSVKEKYKDTVAFVFRNFPISTIHPNARAAAAAAEAAGLNGKFWEMHDLLYENQDSWKDASGEDRTTLFEGYARQIGLDINTYRKTLESRQADIAKKINFDQTIARSVNVSGTPTLFINGKLLETDQYADEAALEKVITEALKEAGVDVEAATTEASQATE